MKKYWKKFAELELNEKLVAAAMILFAVGMTIPVARIMMYCIPWYDDFSYGMYVKRAVESGGGFWDVIKAAAESSRVSYYAWQGTFGSCFLMSIMPAVWGTDKYVLGLWAVLLLFILGIVTLVNVLLRDVLKAKRWTCIGIEAIIVGACVLLFRSPIEGLFWYDAAIHYTGMHGIGLMMIAAVIKGAYTDKKILKGILVAVSVPVAFFVGGANYITTLQMALVLLSILGWGLIFKNKRVLWAIPATVGSLAGLIVNLTAPGSDVRMSYFEGLTMTPVEAVLNSFKEAFGYFGEFTGWMTLAILIMMVPLIIRIVSQTEFEFKYPGLVLLWSFCLYATGFTPTLYTMGHTLISRATSLAHFSFQLLLFLDWIYLIGWSCRKLKERKGKELPGKHLLWFYGVTVLAMLGIFIAEPNKGGEYTTYVSYYFVHTGEAYNYYHEYLDRVETICESEEADVVVRPFVFKPWAMCLGDLSSDPSYEPNRFMAEYFGKNSIVCLTQEQEQERAKQ